MNAPSVSYTATNFRGYSFSVRGIGNMVIGGESGYFLSERGIYGASLRCDFGG